MNRVQTKRGLPWQAQREIVDYFVEIGTTPYGKYGMYKEMVPVGTGKKGSHEKIAVEIQLSNPDIFENLELRQVVSRG
tara:strand:+ start:1113 stop:1346 length:234 start_codon:yes stop_codon:yes gene_type:complete